ncbi:MAG: hypothetical protein N3G20_11975, partial [Verrucomicrobiae bacterium]|nr:hypothetical protein [Verrucomicrobiae bacterium]
MSGFPRLLYAVWRMGFPVCLCCVGRVLFAPSFHEAVAGPIEQVRSTWPQQHSVRREAGSGALVLSTPYYTFEHDLKKGGVVRRIRLTHGRADNLLCAPITTHVLLEDGTLYTDLMDDEPRIEHRRDGLKEVVIVEARLVADNGSASGIRVRTAYEYRWGYLKVQREYIVSERDARVRGVCVLSTVLAPSLTDYGYREGITEYEGAPPFSFGSNRWGKLTSDDSGRPILSTRYIPRSMLFAEPGVEGLEWFVGSELAQWDVQLTGRRGDGLCLIKRRGAAGGSVLSVWPFHSTNESV